MDKKQLDFGKFLKKRRQMCGLTQSQAAEKFLAGGSKQYISNVERGGSISVDTSIRLAKMYGVPKNAIRNELIKLHKKNINEQVNAVYK